MLDEVYSRKFMVANCYPPDVKLTRRENGEHEYRMFEWRSAIESSGFRIASVRSFIPKIRAANALKGCLSVLPRAITKPLYKTNNANLSTTVQWMRQQFTAQNDAPSSEPVLAPKATTVFFVVKN
jgi:hypothetical protein